MTLRIKYMVSKRCKMVVAEELEKLGLHPLNVELGEVEILESIDQEQRDRLKENLISTGLELMDDKKHILVDKIKDVINEMIQHCDDMTNVNDSKYLSERLKCDYSYLSAIFSEVMGITLKQFIINLKIEKVKELLVCDKLNLQEISYRLCYSSVSHLSNQFKKITGLSPHLFKNINQGSGFSQENLSSSV
jgi:AraC-like DNA-binding protein